ncbi:hypothetical protein SHIRM173S_00029 [Streptomyces hirsutus]
MRRVPRNGWNRPYRPPAALIEYEIALETFRVEVENFSRLHQQRLRPVYARLEELEAQILEARAARTATPTTCAGPTRRGPG